MNSSEKPILWHNGLFLQPQHFQQHDFFINSLFTPHNQYHTPYFWGAKSIKIQPAALSQRIIDIEQCEFIFQDGTWVTCPGNSVIEPRSFEDISFDVESSTPVIAYVGLKKWNRNDRNVTPLNPADSISDVGTRYISPIEPEEITDTHEGSDQANIRKKSVNLKLFWDHEIEKYNDYHLIPVLQLELVDDQIEVSKKYVPPTFLVSGSDSLLQILKNLRENMISRCRVFESYKLTQGFQTSDFDAHFIPHLLVLNALNRSIPVLNHIIQVADIHPHSVYLALRQIIGDLSTFSDRINALGVLKDGTALLPEYDHKNLFHCFNEAHILITELLKGISLGGESIFNMVREDDYFTAKIPTDEFQDHYIYFLVLKTSGDSDAVLNDLHNLVKLGSPENIETLITRALPGLPIRHRLVPPPGMPKRSGAYYFRIDAKHSLFEEIKRTGDISLFWDNAPEDASIEIVISQT